MPAVYAECDTTPTLSGNMHNIRCTSDWNNVDLNFLNPTSGGNTFVVYTEPTAFNPADLDLAVVASLFAAGFSVIMIPWLGTVGFRMVFKVFRP